MKTLFRKSPFLIMTILILSCTKDKATNAPTNRSLLLGTWTSRKTTLYKPTGELADVQIISTDPHSFTFGSDLLYYWDNSTSKFHYQLLSDDTTLVLEYYTASGSINDTNYITTLTENLLAFHGKQKLFTPLLTRDTLRR